MISQFLPINLLKGLAFSSIISPKDCKSEMNNSLLFQRLRRDYEIKIITEKTMAEIKREILEFSK